MTSTTTLPTVPPRRWRIWYDRLNTVYVVRRLIYAAITVLGTLSMVFLMMAISGDPARLMLPEDASPEEIALVARAYGLDGSLGQRYLAFLHEVLTGSFPDSLRYQQPALKLVVERLSATIKLSGSALIIAVIGGLLLGYWLAATRHANFARRVLAAFVVLQAVPSLFLALLLVLVFSLSLHWLPTSGYTSSASLVLPIVTLVLYILPSIARIFRSSLIEGYTRDHVITALAKGYPLRHVRIRHVAINCLGPTISYIGLHLGGILGGAVVVESVFAYPGVGQLLTSSVTSRDFPVTLAAVYVIAIGYVGTSMIIDLILRLLDPRIDMR